MGGAKSRPLLSKLRLNLCWLIYFLFAVVDILEWYFYFYFYPLWPYLTWFCFSPWVFYVHNDFALYIFALPQSRILASWLLLSVVKTTINKVYLILSQLFPPPPPPPNTHTHTPPHTTHTPTPTPPPTPNPITPNPPTHPTPNPPTPPPTHPQPPTPPPTHPTPNPQPPTPNPPPPGRNGRKLARRHFQMYFHEWKILYFDSNFTKVSPGVRLIVCQYWCR